MSLTKDRFGGLLFLLLSITYGYYAADIPLLPGTNLNLFTPKLCRTGCLDWVLFFYSFDRFKTSTNVGKRINI